VDVERVAPVTRHLGPGDDLLGLLGRFRVDGGIGVDCYSHQRVLFRFLVFPLPALLLPRRLVVFMAVMVGRLIAAVVMLLLCQGTFDEDANDNGVPAEKQ